MLLSIVGNIEIVTIRWNLKIILKPQSLFSWINIFPIGITIYPFQYSGVIFPQLDKGCYNLIKFNISLASGLGSESDKFMICLRLFSQAYNLLDYHKLHVYMFIQRRVNIHVLMVFILFSCGV